MKSNLDKNLLENNLNKSITIDELNEKSFKFFSPANKEWKNSIYSYNKSMSILAPINNNSSYLLNKNYLNIAPLENRKTSRYNFFKNLAKLSSIKRLFVSKPEIKQTNDKIIITLYTYNREHNYFLKKLYYTAKHILNVIPFIKQAGDNNNSVYNFQKIMYILDRKNFLFNTDISRKHVFLLEKQKLFRHLNNFKQNLILKTKFSYLYNKYISIPFIYTIAKELKILYDLSENKLRVIYPKKIMVVNPNKYEFSNKEKKALEQVKSWKSLFYFLNKNKTNNKIFSVLNIFPIKTNTVNLKEFTSNGILETCSNNADINLKNKSTINIKSNGNNSLLKLINLCINILGNTYGILFSQLYLNWAKKIYLKNIKKVFYNEINIKEKLFSSKYRIINHAKLKYLLEKIFNKKVQLNIVSLKYIYLNSDNYMEAINRKMKGKSYRLMRIIKKSLSLIKLPKYIDHKRKDINSINKIGTTVNKKIHISGKYTNKLNIIKNIKYKWITGVKFETAGRLARKFTSKRSISKSKLLGNLRELSPDKEKGIEKKPASIYKIRGIVNPNIQYTSISSKRRSGSFGIKGWLSSN